MTEELHDKEQYFFDEPTLEHLARFVARFEAPCCLCTPRLGERLTERGVEAAVLDIDERFSALPGFQRFDLERPAWDGRAFGLIVCDPPFYNVSLRKLASAISMLVRHDPRVSVMVSFLARREAALRASFSSITLRPTGFFPTYASVVPGPKNDIQFYSNLSDEAVARLVIQ